MKTVQILNTSISETSVQEVSEILTTRKYQKVAICIPTQ